MHFAPGLGDRTVRYACRRCGVPVKWRNDDEVVKAYLEDLEARDLAMPHIPYTVAQSVVTHLLIGLDEVAPETDDICRRFGHEGQRCIP